MQAMPRNGHAPEQFHVMSFEGPDAYSRAGGISSRVTGLIDALASLGHVTHLWFIGDPELPAQEERGRVVLHRWCQWISRYYPSGVYEGEDAKSSDYAASLPPYMLAHHILPALARSSGRVVVLAEEWQTVHAVLHLDWLLRRAEVRDRVSIFWNANNTFGFEHIDWARLNAAARILTVSRYMKQRMWAYGVNPVAIPNGLGPESFSVPCPDAVRQLRGRLKNRILLTKVARWDPDKRWLLAIDTMAELKRAGLAPLLVARGGIESHEHEVVERARRRGLRVVERHAPAIGAADVVRSLDDCAQADVVVLRTHLGPEARGVLFRASDAVLANSGHEPFGLVGLEAMAVGGLVCTGGSGEDYAVDGENAIVLQQDDPREFVSLFRRLRGKTGDIQRLRHAARRTARQYAWTRVVDRNLLPRV